MEPAAPQPSSSPNPGQRGAPAAGQAGHPAAHAAAHPAAHRGIQNGLVRATVMAVGAIAAGVLAIPVLPFLVGERGVLAPTALDAARPTLAALAVGIGLVAFTLVGAAVGRVINAAVGLFVAGAGVAVLSMRTGSIADAAWDGDRLLPIAFETIAWSGAVAAMSMAIFRASGPLPDIPARNAKGSFMAEVFNQDALRSLAAGLVALAAAWLLVRTNMKGQALGSMVLGCAAVALAARKLQGRSQPILVMAAPVLCIGIMQVLTAVSAQLPLDKLVAGDALPGWSRIMPMDAAAGALMGVPIGLGWSRASTGE
ncbi:MAG: hypothetical protein U0636_09990 [Phycisphaerales bacterium]